MKPIIEPEYQEAWNWTQRNNRELIREFRKEVDPYWAWERRKEYIQTLMAPLVLQSLRCIALQKMNIESGNLTGSVWFGEQAQKCVKQLVRYQNELYYTRPGMENGNSITQEMVIRARQYPYRDLIELKRNMAPCPFHEDKDPSFSVKNNYGHCFGCGWKGDTIAFYMEKMDVAFPVAVKALQ